MFDVSTFNVNVISELVVNITSCTSSTVSVESDAVILYQYVPATDSFASN